MMTSCTIVEEALNTRESSVDNISMTINRQNRPMSPMGRVSRRATGNII